MRGTEAERPPVAAVPGPGGGRPLRVLLTTWQHFGAGSIQSVQYLAEGLRSRGHHVTVACPSDGLLGGRLRAAGVPVVDFRFGRGWNPASGRRLAALIRRLRPDVVDAQESRDRKAAILARWLFRAPAALIVTRRQQTASSFLQNRIYALAADRIVAISHGVRRSLEARGMPRGRIAVVHTGLDARRVAGKVSTDELARLRADLRLDAALPVVGVVARRKDQETLLRAAVALGRPLNLLFVGIEADDALTRLEAALPAGTVTRYTGFRDPVLPFLRLLDVKVLTTRAEGLSQAILECMAVGVPVITAAVGGTPEVVRDGVNGLHYPPGDAAALAERLALVLDDAELAADLVAAGRDTVRGPFAASAFAAATEAVYRDVLATTAPR